MPVWRCELQLARYCERMDLVGNCHGNPWPTWKDHQLKNVPQLLFPYECWTFPPCETCSNQYLVTPLSFSLDLSITSVLALLCCCIFASWRERWPYHMTLFCNFLCPSLDSFFCFLIWITSCWLFEGVRMRGSSSAEIKLERGGEMLIILRSVICCSNDLSKRTSSNILSKCFFTNAEIVVIKDILPMSRRVRASINKWLWPACPHCA